MRRSRSFPKPTAGWSPRPNGPRPTPMRPTRNSAWEPPRACAAAGFSAGNFRKRGLSRGAVRRTLAALLRPDQLSRRSDRDARHRLRPVAARMLSLRPVPAGHGRRRTPAGRAHACGDERRRVGFGGRFGREAAAFRLRPLIRFIQPPAGGQQACGRPRAARPFGRKRPRRPDQGLHQAPRREARRGVPRRGAPHRPPRERRGALRQDLEGAGAAQ